MVVSWSNSLAICDLRFAIIFTNSKVDSFNLIAHLCVHICIHTNITECIPSNAFAFAHSDCQTSASAVIQIGDHLLWAGEHFD